MSALEELLKAIDHSNYHDPKCEWYVGTPCNCRMRPLVDLAARVRAEMDHSGKFGVLSNQEREVLYRAHGMTLASIRSVEAAVRRRILGGE